MALKNGTKRGRNKASTKSNYLGNLRYEGIHEAQYAAQNEARDGAIKALRTAFASITCAMNKAEEAIAYSRNHIRLEHECTAARATQEALHHVLYNTRRMVNAILDNGAPAKITTIEHPPHHI